jgi:hypothetical protein
MASTASWACNEHAIRAKLGRDYLSTTEFEDDPDVPREEVTPDETVGNAQGALIGIGAYFPAVIGSLAVIGSGGTMLGAIAVAALAGGAGAAVGATLARLVGRTHARHLAEHLGRGGLLLWVRTHDARHEEIALDLLKRHGGDHVHLHVLPASQAPLPPIATHRPLLWIGPVA